MREVSSESGIASSGHTKVTFLWIIASEILTYVLRIEQRSESVSMIVLRNLYIEFYYNKA